MEPSFRNRRKRWNNRQLRLVWRVAADNNSIVSRNSYKHNKDDGRCHVLPWQRRLLVREGDSRAIRQRLYLYRRQSSNKRLCILFQGGANQVARPREQEAACGEHTGERGILSV